MTSRCHNHTLQTSQQYCKRYNCNRHRYQYDSKNKLKVNQTIYLPQQDDNLTRKDIKNDILNKIFSMIFAYTIRALINLSINVSWINGKIYGITALEINFLR